MAGPPWLRKMSGFSLFYEPNQPMSDSQKWTVSHQGQVCTLCTYLIGIPTQHQHQHLPSILDDSTTRRFGTSCVISFNFKIESLKKAVLITPTIDKGASHLAQSWEERRFSPKTISDFGTFLQQKSTFLFYWIVWHKWNELLCFTHGNILFSILFYRYFWSSPRKWFSRAV